MPPPFGTAADPITGKALLPPLTKIWVRFGAPTICTSVAAAPPVCVTLNPSTRHVSVGSTGIWTPPAKIDGAEPKPAHTEFTRASVRPAFDFAPPSPTRRNAPAVPLARGTAV